MQWCDVEPLAPGLPTGVGDVSASMCGDSAEGRSCSGPRDLYGGRPASVGAESTPGYACGPSYSYAAESAGPSSAGGCAGYSAESGLPAWSAVRGVACTPPGASWNVPQPPPPAPAAPGWATPEVAASSWVASAPVWAPARAWAAEGCGAAAAGEHGWATPAGSACAAPLVPAWGACDAPGVPTPCGAEAAPARYADDEACRPLAPLLSRPTSPAAGEPPAKRAALADDQGEGPVPRPAELTPPPLLALRRVRVGASRPTPVRPSPPAHSAPRTPAGVPPPAVRERPPRRAASVAAAAATSAALRRSARRGAPARGAASPPKEGADEASPSGRAAAGQDAAGTPSASAAAGAASAGASTAASEPAAAAASAAAGSAASGPSPCGGGAAPSAPVLPKMPAGVLTGPAARRGAVVWNSQHTVDPRTGERVTSVQPATFCSQCGAMDTPVWRAGPFGHKTLCNACGVRWMKVAKKERKLTAAAAQAARAAAARATAAAAAAAQA